MINLLRSSITQYLMLCKNAFLNDWQACNWSSGLKTIDYTGLEGFCEVVRFFRHGSFISTQLQFCLAGRADSRSMGTIAGTCRSLMFSLQALVSWTLFGSLPVYERRSKAHLYFFSKQILKTDFECAPTAVAKAS